MHLYIYLWICYIIHTCLHTCIHHTYSIPLGTESCMPNRTFTQASTHTIQLPKSNYIPAAKQGHFLPAIMPNVSLCTFRRQGPPARGRRAAAASSADPRPSIFRARDLSTQPEFSDVGENSGSLEGPFLKISPVSFGF